MAVETFDAPTLGVDLESAPVRIGKGYASQSTNLLPGYKGRAPVRGPLITSAEFSPVVSTPRAVWAHPNGFLLSHEGGGTTCSTISADFSSASASAAVASAAHIPGPAYVNVGPYVYGIGWPVATSQNITHLLRWDGTPAGVTFAGSVVKYNNIPWAGIFSGTTGAYMRGIAHWLQRLWVLTETNDSSNATFGLVLHWTDPFAPDTALADTAAVWQDDASGLTNTVVLDVPSGFVSGKALMPIGRALGVFTSDAVYMVRGGSPSNIAVRRELYRGVISNKSVLQYDDGVIFVSADGVYYYDGAQLVDLSENIKTKFERGTYSDASIMSLGRDYVAVTLVSQATSQPTWAGILHVPSRAWTELKADANIWNDQYPAFVGGRTSAPVAADDQRLWKLDTIVRPKGPVSGTVQMGRDVKSGTFRSIVATATTRCVRLAGPLVSATIKRLYADYIQNTAGTPDASAGWSFVLRDSTKTKTLATVTVADTDDSVAGLRHRHIAEPNVETEELFVEATFTGSTTANYEAELHDMFVEFEPAQRPASF